MQVLRATLTFRGSRNSLNFYAIHALAASHIRCTKLPRWRAKVELGQDKQKTCIN